MNKLVFSAVLVLSLVAVISFAQPFPFEFSNVANANDAAVSSAVPILYTNQEAVPGGMLIQIIKPGANGVLDPPATTGNVGNDDVLATSTKMGIGIDERFCNPKGIFDVMLTGITPDAQSRKLMTSGSQFYCRVWYNVAYGTPFGAGFLGGHYCEGGPFNTPSDGFGTVLNAQMIPNSTNPTWHTLGAPTMTITFPNGGESVKVGDIQTIQWEKSDVAGNVMVEINKNYPDENGWTTLYESIPNTGSIPWLVDASEKGSVRIRISSVSDPTVKATSEGNVAVGTLGVLDNTPSLPTEFSIKSAYPNPFNSEISFLIGVPQNSEVRLLVFNMLGQQVASLHSGALKAGYHRFEWNATGFASGSYIARMEAPNFTKTMLIRYLR